MVNKATLVLKFIYIYYVKTFWIQMENIHVYVCISAITDKQIADKIKMTCNHKVVGSDHNTLFFNIELINRM